MRNQLRNACVVSVPLVWLVWLGACGAARVLGVFPTFTSSHYAMYGTIMRELAARGHDVTVASHFPQKNSTAKMKEVSLLDIIDNPYMTVEELQDLTHVQNIYDMFEFTLYTCDGILKHPSIRQLVKPGEYDLFVTEIFGAECFLPIGYKLGVPTVGIVSSVTLPWVGAMTANPDNPSHTPLYFLPFTEHMSFSQRVVNTLMAVYANYLYETHSRAPSQRLAEAVLGPLPPLREMASNFSLILANSHYSVNQVRATVPQLVEVGGLHIPKSIPPLPEDLENFINESKDGVILFSLGTFVPTDSIPEDKLMDIISVLGALKQRVLWKINGTSLPPLPPNVRTRGWLPQLAILCHPKARMFIGHGGLLGLQEAIFCGLPVLGMPLFADQYMNMAGLEEKGAALTLRYRQLDRHSLAAAVKALLYDEKYRAAAQHLSQVFRARPQHPLDAAVFWIEYVLKFGGAPHLRSAAHGLHWAQFLLLDVALLLLALLALAAGAACCLLKALSTKLIGYQKHKSDHIKKNK